MKYEATNFEVTFSFSQVEDFITKFSVKYLVWVKVFKNEPSKILVFHKFYLIHS